MNDLSNFGLNSCCQLYMLGAGLVSFVFVFQSVWDLVLKKSKRLNTVKTKKIRESTQFSAFVCVSACICICAWYAYVCVYIVCVCYVYIWMYCLALYVYIYVCVCNVYVCVCMCVYIHVHLCACICVQIHVVARYFTRVSFLRCHLLYFLLYSLSLAWR